MASSIAHAEPLPLVPPTVTTTKTGSRRSDSLTARTRSSPIAIPWGCTRSMYRRHSSSVVGRGRAASRVIQGNSGCAGNRCSACAACRRRSSGGRQLEEQRDERRKLVAHLAPVDDHVDGAVLQQEFGALEAFRQGLAHRLLDDARPGETD